MMNYLSLSGASLLDIVTTTDKRYNKIKQKMFSKAKANHFEEVLDLSRSLIMSEKPGSNVLRYLLQILKNKVLKRQYMPEKNRLLSDLFLDYGCIPFDQMPYASSLLQHNPDSSELFDCIDCEGREHELLARYIHNNMSTNAKLYTSIKKIESNFDNVDELIQKFNNNINYKKHKDRRTISKFGENIYIKSALTDTESIIRRLQTDSQVGLQGYRNAICTWIEENIECPEKKKVLKELYSQTRVALLYGAAGTGKTYLINFVSQFFDSHSKLFLANTNPAVDNLRRNVKAQNCEFSTVRRYLMTKNIKTDYDMLIMDECSMVSNEDMAEVLNKVKCEIMLLVGDTYQIESIAFGNWFAMAKYFMPKYAWHELETPYRTKDKALLTLWSKVRNLDDDLTEHIVNYRYSSNLNATVFEKRADDEIILCLNYDGLYGINNINRFLQENNPNPAHRWGLWTFKVGDPILFNELERFAPLLYNNLKGKIVGIEEDHDCERIWFTIELDKALTELDVKHYDIELMDETTPGKSIIRFHVAKKNEDDDNDSTDDTDIPFQIAYAVSIHKAQGLEYDSVKIIIPEEVDEMITHNIFYTAITRAKKHLMIYWSPETQEKVISSFEIKNSKNDATIFAAQTGLEKRKVK
ncbi:MAG: ATP-dependent DNA helicase [Bacillota bacterium]